MNTMLLLGNTVLLVVIAISLYNNKKVKLKSKILFETQFFPLYKIMTYMGFLSIMLLVVLFAMLIFDPNPDIKSIVLQGVTWLLVFFSQWVTYPKQIVVTTEGIYYPMRFRGFKLASNFKNIGSYDITSKNKLEVISKFDSSIKVTIMGVLSQEEIALLEKVLNSKEINKI